MQKTKCQNHKEEYQYTQKGKDLESVHPTLEGHTRDLIVAKCFTCNKVTARMDLTKGNN